MVAQTAAKNNLIGEDVAIVEKGNHEVLPLRFLIRRIRDLENMDIKTSNRSRRSIRLKNYNYAQADLYFITICTQNRRCLFGAISRDVMQLSDAGRMIEQQWNALSMRFKKIRLDHYVVMPNHFHGIIEILANAQTENTIGEMVGAFKSLTTKYYINQVRQKNWLPFNNKLWQRNYYEHVIRDEKSHLQIIEYIQTNPQKWHQDAYYEVQNP